MSVGLIYLAVELLVFLAISHLLFLYLETKEKDFLIADRLFLLAPNRFNMFLLIIVSGFVCYVIGGFKWVNSISQVILFSSAVTATIMVLFIYKNFVWVHFLNERIVVRYPLRKIVVEIPIRNIERSGFRAKHYFIEFIEKGKMKMLSFNSPVCDTENLSFYLRTRHIKS